MTVTAVPVGAPVRRPITCLATILASLAVGAALLSACSTAQGAAPGLGPGRVVHVVAAENFWGSLARQIGGRHVSVISIISNPNADPHTYEPTAIDARLLAGAQLVIENGIGYDPWMPRLVAATQGTHTVLDVGHLVGVPVGGNPHRWYNPADVLAVINRIAADLAALDPADRAYFARQRARLVTVGLREYNSLIAAIKARYGGTPVGASESIFAMMAPALGLRLITPYSFLKAISEGTEVSAADKATIDQQIRQHRIKIYVYNRQNVTPDVLAQLAEVRAMHIPTATITETLVPPTASFQAWQVAELRGIEAALAAATGR